MKRKLFLSILSMGMAALLLAGCVQTDEAPAGNGQTVQGSENTEHCISM